MIFAIFKQSDFCCSQVTVLHPALQQASGVFRVTRQVENTVCYIKGVLKKATNITFCDQNRNAPTKAITQKLLKLLNRSSVSYIQRKILALENSLFDQVQVNFVQGGGVKIMLVTFF